MPQAELIWEDENKKYPLLELYRSHEDQYILRMAINHQTKQHFYLTCSSDFKESRFYATPNVCNSRNEYTFHVQWCLSIALRLVYAQNTLPLDTILIHASVVKYQNMGYLFLGQSGAGKSTHSRQWLKQFPEAELMNDDNPVIRLDKEGTLRVYGSPWSGKTMCFKNMDAPIGGMASIVQAPANQTQPIIPIQAYCLITSSATGFKWFNEAADGLYHTAETVVSRIPIMKLECLPNTDAARVCYESLKQAYENNRRI